MQRLYTKGGAAYELVRNLVKACNLTVSKLRRFLHSKPVYIKFTLASHKFQRLKAFARFQVENWTMELADLQKLAKDKNCVKCLLVRRDLFDRIVDGELLKTKDSKETVRAFFTMITKKN